MKKGISLIILIVTIVVTLILLSIVIFNLSNDNITSKATEVSFKASIKMYQEQLNSYISNKRMEYKLNGEQYDPSLDLDLTVENAIPGMKVEDKLNFYISNGKLYYNGENKEWVPEISTDYVQTEGVNRPKLINGMTAIKWNNTTRTWDTILNPNVDTTWYDYNNKEWANAKTSDGSMWVWIPRYKYAIKSSSYNQNKLTPDSVNIIFDDGTLSKENGTGINDSYLTHPAFTFGNVELTGIWVAKFEASSVEGYGGSAALDDVTTKTVQVKPDVLCWKFISISKVFINCLNMQTNNHYGWGTTGNGLDTHMMKNIEWGAVAYLTQSIYGKNSQVWINPISTTGKARNRCNYISIRNNLFL